MKWFGSGKAKMFSPENINFLQDAILKVMLPCLLGGVSYLFWRWFGLQSPVITNSVGFLAMIPVILIAGFGLAVLFLIRGLSNQHLLLLLVLPLLIPCTLGWWLHEISVRDIPPSYLIGSLLMITATTTSGLAGLFLFPRLPSSGSEIFDYCYTACLTISPSLAPLFPLIGRNLKLRPGYDTPMEH